MKIEQSASRIEGPNLALRLVELDDAGYIFGLRSNPAYNEHLTRVSGTAEDQRSWIEAYKSRELVGSELYYVIERHDGQLCGTVRLYKINENNFTWGSWILDQNKPSKAALESAILSFEVGFSKLDLPIAYVDVRVGNKNAAAFYRRLGMEETHRTAENIFFTYSRSCFEASRSELVNVIHVETDL